MMENQESLSQRIAKFALSLQLADVPEEVVEYGTLLLTDTFGVAMSCQNMEHAGRSQAGGGGYGKCAAGHFVGNQ